MQTVQFPLTSNVEATTVQECAGRLLSETGPMLACVWPELDAWLDELVPELSDNSRQDLAPAWRLTERQRRRLLSPEFYAVYPVPDALLLSRLILAAIRHSELSIVFSPAGVSRGKFASLLRLADRAAFQPVEESAPLGADWLLDVGSYDGDDEVIRIFSDQIDRLTRLTELLAPLNLDRATPPEGPRP
jgi:hypothetical protein